MNRGPVARDENESQLEQVWQMRKRTFETTRFWLCCSLALLFTGCAEGVLWRAGQYSPWVRDQWEAEEKIADTLFSRKRKMNDMVAAVRSAPVESQEPVALRLTETVNRDPVLLMRLYAVKLLGDLNCPTSIQGLADASSDHVSDVRIEAVRAWSKLPGSIAVPRLQEMIGSDTNVDVRLAATAALGKFPGRQSIQALSLALQDRNPALQLRATESLALVTGENLGRNVEAWQQFVQHPATETPESNATGTQNSTESVADRPLFGGEDGEFRR